MKCLIDCVMDKRGDDPVVGAVRYLGFSREIEIPFVPEIGLNLVMDRSDAGELFIPEVEVVHVEWECKLGRLIALVHPVEHPAMHKHAGEIVKTLQREGWVVYDENFWGDYRNPMPSSEFDQS